MEPRFLAVALAGVFLTNTTSFRGALEAAGPLQESLLPATGIVGQTSLQKTSSTPQATLSSKKAIPFQYLRINGSFQTNVPTTVQFLFGKTSLSVTPTVVTSNMVRVAAPPLLKGQVFVGGSAKVTVIQGTGTTTTSIFAGTLTVARLPKVKLPPGVVTKSFINVAKGIVTDAQTKIQGSALDTAQTADTITATLTFFDAMTANVNTAVEGAKKKSMARSQDSSDSDYTVALSVSTVKQLDSYYAGFIAAGQLNTTDPEMILAYKSWNEAIQGSQYDAAAALKLSQAEQEYKQVVNTAAFITGEVKNLMALKTTVIANLGIASIAFPAVSPLAAGLALSSAVLDSCVILGLDLDAGLYALAGNNGQSQAYLLAAGNMAQDSLVNLGLGAFAKFAGGESFKTLVTSLVDLYNSEMATLQNVVPQPAIPPDTQFPTNLPKGNYAMTMSGTSEATCCGPDGCTTSTYDIPQTDLGAIPMKDPKSFEKTLVEALDTAAASVTVPGCSLSVSYSTFTDDAFTATLTVFCTSPGCTTTATVNITLQKQ